MYGTTHFSLIESGCGSVFQLSPPTVKGGAWNATSIYNFSSGCGSEASLTPGPGGVLYGTTYFGSVSATPCTYPINGGCGTVFQLTPPATAGGIWTETTLYSFTGVNGDGAYPSSSVVVGKNGALYGTTQYGGNATAGPPCSYYGVTGCGTVFQLTPPTLAGGMWTETVLHNFTGQNGDGAVPMAGLTWSSTETLYGTASSGGVSGKGTVFAVKPN